MILESIAHGIEQHLKDAGHSCSIMSIDDSRDHAADRQVMILCCYNLRHPNRVQEVAVLYFNGQHIHCQDFVHRQEQRFDYCDPRLIEQLEQFLDKVKPRQL